MIHPQAIVDPSAKIAPDVQIGPWCWIGANVEIGAGTIVEPSVVIKGPTKIGKNNHIYQFSTLGEASADKKYAGEDTWLEIGDRNVIREGVTIHRGTVQDQSLTKIGNDNLLMAYVHIGHDCVLGDNIVMVNNASVAGHVQVGNWAILSGYSLVHQYCIVGEHSYAGMASHIGKDIPAYMLVYGQPAAIKTINLEGLKRRDFSSDDIALVKKAYRILYRRGLNVEDALQQIIELAPEAKVLQPLIQSVKGSQRGIIR